MNENQKKDRKQIATEYFASNFNCSQAVFTTFAVEEGIPEELALRIATQFGGGCRKGEVCGAVSGALMVLGLMKGHCHRNAPEEKASAYRLAEEFMDRFAERQGTVVCRERLGYNVSIPEDMAKIRELGLFQSICPEMIRCATEIVEEMLKEL